MKSSPLPLIAFLCLPPLLVLLPCLPGFGAEADKIIVHAQIDGKPSRLVYDTGSVTTALFEDAARRLQLDWTSPPSKSNPAGDETGKTSYGLTRECQLMIGDRAGQLRLAVLSLPAYLNPEYDGVLSWNTLGSRYLRISARELKIQIPANDAAFETTGWEQWPIREDFPVLVIDTGTGSPEAIENSVFIDTGSSGGLQLPPPLWKKWQDAHPNVPRTLEAVFVPGQGSMVKEVCLADEIQVGGLTLKRVPVSPAAPDYGKVFPNFSGILGLGAFTTRELVLDLESNRVLTRPISDDEKSSLSPSLDHNRLGAVFIPGEKNENDLIAQVIPGSPAHRAGIRDGDQLLKIDGNALSGGSHGPANIPGKQYWNQPAGTRFDLVLRRANGGPRYEVTVELEEILGTGE